MARTCRAVLRAPRSSAGGAQTLDLGPAGGLASDLFKVFQLIIIYLRDLQLWRHQSEGNHRLSEGTITGQRGAVTSQKGVTRLQYQCYHTVRYFLFL